MPSKLLDRLRHFLDEDPALNHIMPAQHPPAAQPNHPAPPHWPGGNFGNILTNVQSVVIHETSGYPTYASVQGFIDRYTSAPTVVANDPNDLGVGPHFYVSGNGTVYRLMDVDPPHLTSHAGFMNNVSVGIENGDIGDTSQIGPDAVITVREVQQDNPAWTPAKATQMAAAYQAAARAYWRSFSTDPTVTPLNPAIPEDLAGLKSHLLLHPGQSATATTEEAVLIWFGMPTYSGPQNAAQARGNFRRMLFTEPDIRSLVLLCRYLAEQLQIPRNFPVFPYVTMDGQSVQTASQQQQQQQIAMFRKFILCDERSDQLATAAGTTLALITNNDPSLPGWFQGRIVRNQDSHGHPFTHNLAWTNMLSNPTNGYRGIVGHGFVGDIAARDSHSMCPGPFFDWHRFSREVWDWWWYCFDFAAASTTATPQTSQTQRPYRNARGDTPLREYYYDADGQPSDYTTARLPASEIVNGGNTFATSAQTPIFALANGVLVAARIPAPSVVATQSSNGFVLIRHEVFCQRIGNRIDYNSDPIYVYSLTYYLQAPRRVIDNVSDNNPDWFNRFMMRLKETELAVQFHAAHSAPAAPDVQLGVGWTYRPTGGGNQRPRFGDLVTTDATAYRQAADLLAQGNVAYFPVELRPGATPVRVILGDFLGFAGIVDGSLSGNQTGVMVDIFSVNPLPQPFSATPSTVPVGRNVASPLATSDWWPTVCRQLTLEQDAAKELPTDGVVWHYDMVDFLAWINRITWVSEWQKYGIVSPVYTDAPPRPKSRK